MGKEKQITFHIVLLRYQLISASPTRPIRAVMAVMVCWQLKRTMWKVIFSFPAFASKSRLNYIFSRVMFFKRDFELIFHSVRQLKKLAQL